MSVQEILNLFGSLGLIATGSLLGSLITIIVSHFLDKSKLKTERESQLQKEIYFKAQKKAEEILLGSERYKELFAKFMVTLKYNTCYTQEYNSETIKTHFGEYKDKLALNIGIYFPTLKEKYTIYGKSIVVVTDLFFNIIRKGSFVADDIKQITEAFNDFNTKNNVFVNDLLEELDKIRNRII